MASLKERPIRLWLPQSCTTCRHFDGEVHCGLPWREALIRGRILEHEQVVCAKHQPIEHDIEGAAV